MESEPDNLEDFESGHSFALRQDDGVSSAARDQDSTNRSSDFEFKPVPGAAIHNGEDGEHSTGKLASHETGPSEQHDVDRITFDSILHAIPEETTVHAWRAQADDPPVVNTWQPAPDSAFQETTPTLVHTADAAALLPIPEESSALYQPARTSEKSCGDANLSSGTNATDGPDGDPNAIRPGSSRHPSGLMMDSMADAGYPSGQVRHTSPVPSSERHPNNVLKLPDGMDGSQPRPLQALVRNTSIRPGVDDMASRPAASEPGPLAPGTSANKVIPRIQANETGFIASTVSQQGAPAAGFTQPWHAMLASLWEINSPEVKAPRPSDDGVMTANANLMATIVQDKNMDVPEHHLPSDLASRSDLEKDSPGMPEPSQLSPEPSPRLGPLVDEAAPQLRSMELIDASKAIGRPLPPSLAAIADTAGSDNGSSHFGAQGMSARAFSARGSGVSQPPLFNPLTNTPFMSANVSVPLKPTSSTLGRVPTTQGDAAERASHLGADPLKAQAPLGLDVQDINAVNEMATAFQDTIQEQVDVAGNEPEVPDQASRSVKPRRLFNLILTASLALVAVCLRYLAQDVMLFDSPLYIFFAFFAGLLPLKWVSSFVIICLQSLVMPYLSSTAMLYTVSGIKPGANMLWTILLIPWWIFMFGASSGFSADSDFRIGKDAFNVVIKVLICLSLFRLVILLKVLAARYISLSFYRQAQCERLHKAYLKEHLLSRLCVSRAMQTERSHNTGTLQKLTDRMKPYLKKSKRHGLFWRRKKTDNDAGAMDSDEEAEGRRSAGICTGKTGPNDICTSTNGIAAVQAGSPAASLHQVLVEPVNSSRRFVLGDSVDMDESSKRGGTAGRQPASLQADGVAAFNSTAPNFAGWIAGLPSDRLTGQTSLHSATATTIYPGGVMHQASLDQSPRPSVGLRQRSGGGLQRSSSQQCSHFSRNLSHRSQPRSRNSIAYSHISNTRNLARAASQIRMHAAEMGRTGKAILTGGLGAVTENAPAAWAGITKTESAAQNDDAWQASAKVMAIADRLRTTPLTFQLPSSVSKAIAGEFNLHIGSEHSAKSLAYYLFWNLLPQGVERRHILQDDLLVFFHGQQDKAGMAFEMLDADRDGAVTASDLRAAIIDVYRERRNLTNTIVDAQGVVAKLESIMGGIMHFAMLFAYLAVFDVNVGTLWITLSSAILAFAFVFGNSIKLVYENVIFLFVVHPFDVGDYLRINHNDGTIYMIEEINLMSCTLIRWDGSSIMYPNSWLSTMPIWNVSRSRNREECHFYHVDHIHAAQPDVIEIVKKYIDEETAKTPLEYSSAGAYVCWWGPSEQPGKIILGVFQGYAHNGADAGRMVTARTPILCAVARAFVALGIKWSMPMPPSSVDAQGNRSAPPVNANTEAGGPGRMQSVMTNETSQGMATHAHLSNLQHLQQVPREQPSQGMQGIPILRQDFASTTGTASHVGSATQGHDSLSHGAQAAAMGFVPFLHM